MGVHIVSGIEPWSVYVVQAANPWALSHGLVLYFHSTVGSMRPREGQRLTQGCTAPSQGALNCAGSLDGSELPQRVLLLSSPGVPLSGLVLGDDDRRFPGLALSWLSAVWVPNVTDRRGLAPPALDQLSDGCCSGPAQGCLGSLPATCPVPGSSESCAGTCRDVPTR